MLHEVNYYNGCFEKVGAILDLPYPSVILWFCHSVITFQMKIYWVPCGHNSSYHVTVFHGIFWNFADVFCMEWRCACVLTFSALWTCLFSVWNAVSGYLVGATPLTVFHRLYWNFARFLYRMKICMWFWYNTLIIIPLAYMPRGI